MKQEFDKPIFWQMPPCPFHRTWIYAPEANIETVPFFHPSGIRSLDNWRIFLRRQMEEGGISFGCDAYDEVNPVVEEGMAASANLLDALDLLIQTAVKHVNACPSGEKRIELLMGKTGPEEYSFDVFDNGARMNLDMLAKLGTRHPYGPYALAFWKLRGTGASLTLGETGREVCGMRNQATFTFNRLEELIVESGRWEELKKEAGPESWVEYRFSNGKVS